MKYPNSIFQGQKGPTFERLSAFRFPPIVGMTACGGGGMTACGGGGMIAFEGGGITACGVPLDERDSRVVVFVKAKEID